MRKAKTNTRLELIRVLETFKYNEDSDDGPSLYTIKDKLYKDFKVEFDNENQSDLSSDKEFTMQDREGYIQINGTWMYIGWAGGDWESPVYFVLYLDPKGKLRAYIPTDGNCYNKEYMMAYGNNDEDEDENFEEPEPDFDLMIKDITERIEVEPAPKSDYEIIRDLKHELKPYWESEGSEWGGHISTLCDLDSDCLSTEFVPHFIKELERVLETCKEQTKIVDGEIVWN